MQRLVTSRYGVDSGRDPGVTASHSLAFSVGLAQEETLSRLSFFEGAE
jgi:hypothetical protein